MFTTDIHNDIGRYCTVRGDKSGRVWKVKTAVTDGRYLVRNTKTGDTKTVPHKDLSNLY